MPWNNPSIQYEYVIGPCDWFHKQTDWPRYEQDKVRKEKLRMMVSGREEFEAHQLDKERVTYTKWDRARAMSPQTAQRLIEMG